MNLDEQKARDKRQKLLMTDLRGKGHWTPHPLGDLESTGALCVFLCFKHAVNENWSWAVEDMRGEEHIHFFWFSQMHSFAITASEN